MNQQAGKYIIVTGFIIVAGGILIYLFPNKPNWFGQLPGDTMNEKENTKFYFPIVSML